MKLKAYLRTHQIYHASFVLTGWIFSTAYFGYHYGLGAGLVAFLFSHVFFLMLWMIFVEGLEEHCELCGESGGITKSVVRLETLPRDWYQEQQEILKCRCTKCGYEWKEDGKIIPCEEQAPEPKGTGGFPRFICVLRSEDCPPSAEGKCEMCGFHMYFESEEQYQEDVKNRYPEN